MNLRRRWVSFGSWRPREYGHQSGSKHFLVPTTFQALYFVLRISWETPGNPRTIHCCQVREGSFISLTREKEDRICRPHGFACSALHFSFSAAYAHTLLTFKSSLFPSLFSFPLCAGAWVLGKETSIQGLEVQAWDRCRAEGGGGRETSQNRTVVEGRERREDLESIGIY